MIQFALRIDEQTMEKARALANEHGISINKELNSLIKMALINNYYEFDSLSDYLKNISKQSEKLIKLQAKHFALSTQHFVNQGYSMNLDPKEDKTYQDFLNKKDPFNS